MANKVIITADRTCDINEFLCKKFNVVDIPLHIVFGDESFDDWETITPEECFDRFKETGELPKTTAISIGEYEDLFKPYIDQGYDIVHLSLGSSLSTTYNSATIAAQSFPGRVFVIDTQNLSTGSGLLVLKACDMRDEGLSASEINDKILQMVDKSHASFILNTLQFLAAGGRCSAIALFGANLLKIRPSIEVDNQNAGAMGVAKKYRGVFNKCVLEYVNDTIAKYDNIDTTRCFVTYSGGGTEYNVEEIKKVVEDMGIFDEIYITRASCVISSHCGPNCIGVLFMTK